MKRSLLLFPLLLTAAVLFGQVDTIALERIYDRAVHLTEAQTDSIGYYADYINHVYLKGQYPEAKVMALSLYGYYYENKADYKKAIDYYLQSLDEARKIGDVASQIKCLTDLAAVYTQDMKQPQKAKEVYLECVKLNQRLGDPHSIVASYVNLSAIYTHLGLYDSSLLFLKEGLQIVKPLGEKGAEDLYGLYNNIGNTNYCLKNYDTALVYFRKNYSNDLAGHAPTRQADLWLDALNMADSYTQKGSFDSAGKYADLSLRLSEQLDSKSKQSDSYQILSKLEQHRGDYKKAWEYQGKWYALDTALVNSDTYKAIAELEQKYEARESENRNLLLQSEITQQKFHYRIMMIMAISLLLIAIAAALAFIVKRNVNRKLQATNDLVIRQNERLSELNYEKNSLISIVSHDLSTPFASIGMWHQLLQDENLTADQKKALDRIGQATQYGEKLIRRILDVEKAETNQRMVQLENLDLRIFTETILEDFTPAAAKKEIQLHLECPNRSIYFLSDRQLLGRMLENLLSNAIKYTSTGKNVWISVSDEKDAISIKVRDEGVGIQPDELPHLFSKYSKISSQPTNGEPSTGLGLAIVRRICEELNGQISCESSPGNGSVFTVVLKK
ncbi:MAG TPA: tetratricopeptide repeat-containing sensor histidine kinase [Puia sp.]